MIAYPKVKDIRYRVWTGMKTRCFNPNSEHFKDYGGRGITVCRKWKESFEDFASDMGPRPSMSHSIERVDNDGDYCPENCVWATMKEQAVNRRNTAYLTVKGEVTTRVAAARESGLNDGTVRNRLRRGWSDEEAVGVAPRPETPHVKGSHRLFVERSGQKYGCFILTKISERSTSRHTYWDAACKCGKFKSIRTDHLKRYASPPSDCDGARNDAPTSSQAGASTGRAFSSRALPVNHSERKEA